MNLDRQLDVTQYPFDVNANVRGSSDVEFVSGEDAINLMIYHLLTTEKGTRTHQPLYGSDIPNLLFEPVDLNTAYDIETEIYDVIQMWLGKYVALNYSASFIQPIAEESSYFVYLEYYNKLTKRAENYTVVIRKV